MTNEWKESNLTEEEILSECFGIKNVISHYILQEEVLQSPESLLCVRSSPHTQVFIRASMEVTLPRTSQIYIWRLLW